MTASSLDVPLVLDASAAVDLLLGRPDLAHLLGEQDLHVPMHFDVEVTSALRSLLLRRRIAAPELDRARTFLRRLILVRHPPVLLLDRAWELKESVAIQDGTYVALAEVLGCPLVTTDRRLAREVDGVVTVIVPNP